MNRPGANFGSRIDVARLSGGDLKALGLVPRCQWRGKAAVVRTAAAMSAVRRRSGLTDSSSGGEGLPEACQPTPPATPFGFN